ncbi:hypothetical protein LV779_36570 [Streptomyces thinghirensis]|nr:hypothetical protein [Streptomyces thinghirensis]
MSTSARSCATEDARRAQQRCGPSTSSAPATTASRWTPSTLESRWPPPTTTAAPSPSTC